MLVQRIWHFAWFVWHVVEPWIKNDVTRFEHDIWTKPYSGSCDWFTAEERTKVISVFIFTMFLQFKQLKVNILPSSLMQIIFVGMVVTADASKNRFQVTPENCHHISVVGADPSTLLYCVHYSYQYLNSFFPVNARSLKLTILLLQRMSFFFLN